MSTRKWFATHLGLSMAATLFAASAWAVTGLDCGGASTVQTHARYTTDKICMTDAASAIAAAKFALAQVMIAPTGITCNNQDCTPSTCHTAIWYWTVGQLIVHTVTDGELTCAWAEWIGGEFQVICTACTHI